MSNERLYLGVDIGGTKVQASLMTEAGAPVGKKRCPTPRHGGSEEVLAALEGAIGDVLDDQGLKPKDLAAIGVAVPGVVEPDKGFVVVTPNMNLTGVALGEHLKRRFDVPIAIGNDCNLGALGEAWLGSARNAKSVVSMLVGTGIGGGFVRKGKLWRGAREAGGEIGHMVMQIGGPECGCGNRGCFEALASRTAIERDIREAVAAGRSSAITELTEGDLSVIRSGMLRRAIEADDDLIKEVLRRASEVIGHACLTVRHLIDPEVIVLGGGVVEACSDFMLPIVESIVGADRLAGAREGGRVLLCALGDDAVVMGAVAEARNAINRSPFKKRYSRHPKVPRIERVTFGEITIGDDVYGEDIYIRATGKVRKRKKDRARERYGSSHVIGVEEIAKVCKGAPELVIIGTGMSGQAALNEDARRYLDQRAIECQVLPTPEAVTAYNDSPKRKAAVVHVTC